MEGLAKQFPPGITYSIPYDSTLFVESSIHDVISTLEEAIVLVIIVVLVFLGSLRTSFIPMLAVPVSLIGTFAAFLALGFSINTLTLFGLVLAVGLVVDDAIVVVEAVEKHLEDGLTPVEAADAAMDDLTGPIISIALVLTSVFVPSAFVTGITGQLYKQFALTLSVSVIISTIVALTLTPALCVLILRGKGRLWGPFGWLIRPLQRRLRGDDERLPENLDWLLRHSRSSSRILGLFYIADGSWGPTSPARSCRPKTRASSSPRFSCRSARRCRATTTSPIRSPATCGKSGVENVITLGGFNVLNSVTQPDTSTLVVVLKDWDQRKSAGDEPAQHHPDDIRQDRTATRRPPPCRSSPRRSPA